MGATICENGSCEHPQPGFIWHEDDHGDVDVCACCWADGHWDYEEWTIDELFDWSSGSIERCVEPCKACGFPGWDVVQMGASK